MSERKISYQNRTFEEYRNALRDYTAKYYSDMTNDLDDASIGSWFIDLVSAVADNLSFHIDRVYNETNIDSAEKKSSIYSLARSNGLRIPGPKAAMVEVEFSCILPVTSENANDGSVLYAPNWSVAPVIHKGLKVKSNNGMVFETVNDIDFSEQFNDNGESNRVITPFMDSSHRIIHYVVKKTDVAIAGETLVYKVALSSNMIKPFMEIILPNKNVMSVDSIILKDGLNYNTLPNDSEFSYQSEFVPAEESLSKTDTYRFFEVNSLLEQYRWGDDIDTTSEGNESVANSVTYKYGYYDTVSNTDVETQSITKGAWMPLTQKFITEYTDNGYLKVIFGSGDEIGQETDLSKMTTFSQYQMTRMIRNNHLGKLPKDGCTMFIRYLVGGGSSSNVAKDTVKKIINHDKIVPKYCNNNKLTNSVIASITVTNPTTSVSGKDMPTTEEIKAMIKYNNAAQERCVTLKDYEDRISKMPPRYGCPFRAGVTEENNKVMIYLLSIDNSGKLTTEFPKLLMSNIENYLSGYRTINDYIEIKSGRIVNVSFEVDVFVDKNYNSASIVGTITDVITDYMDINKHRLGEDIYVGDIEKEISKIDGVLNLIDMRIYNEVSGEYSPTPISQDIIVSDAGMEKEVDLDASDYILNSEADEMFEIKYPEKDIRIRIKSR